MAGISSGYERVPGESGGLEKVDWPIWALGFNYLQWKPYLDIKRMK